MKLFVMILLLVFCLLCVYFALINFLSSAFCFLNSKKNDFFDLQEFAEQLLRLDEFFGCLM